MSLHVTWSVVDERVRLHLPRLSPSVVMRQRDAMPRAPRSIAFKVVLGLGTALVAFAVVALITASI